MSESVQPVGRGPSGGVVEVVTETWSKATLLYWPMSCDVTNSPIETAAGIVTVETPSGVQELPSADSHEVNVLPARWSISHLFGALKPAG